MADRPSDTARPGPLGGTGSQASPGTPPGGVIGGDSNPTVTVRPSARALPASTIQPTATRASLACMVAMLDHEPSVGMAIVDTQARALHANRRFTALTVPVQHVGEAAAAEHVPRKGVWARVGPQAVARARHEARPVVLHFIHDGRQVQCDVWPLPPEPDGETAREPVFLVLAVEGRFEPGPADAVDTAARPEASRSGGQSAAQVVEARPDAPGTAGEAIASVVRGRAPGGAHGGGAQYRSGRFATMSTDLAEMGDLAPLTSRELEVLALIGQGLATREIAAALGRSPRTVERHCDGIHKKLGTTNRVQMARYAMRAGLTVEAGKLKKV